ncbi:MAG: TonB dependent receptor [Muribaculaceae bacterium]|nr:TonB dependent receptor [Muribaculaceae bacterium]
MKRIIIIIMAMVGFISANAKKYTYSFHNTPVSHALVEISQDHPDINIAFIYKELGNYKTSSKIDTDDIGSAIRQIIGLHPITLSEKKGNYYVEALQHGKYTYSGQVIDSDNEPVEAATIMLLNPRDSSLITYGFSDDYGRFHIPCDIAPVVAKFSCLGYKPATHSLNNFSAGTVIMEFQAVELNTVTVSADPVIRKIDRQVITPNEQQRRASTNGINLIIALNLPRISVSTLNNTINIDGQDAVQLRINGVEVTTEEVLALNPQNISRVEYIDNPGMRYGGVKAVMNYIVKYRTSGGNVNGDFTQAANYGGWGGYNLAGRYNTEKSMFNAVVNWERRDNDWIRENEETYHFTDRAVTNKEVGEKTPFKYDQIKASLRYVWQDGDKQMLSINARNYYKDEPNSFADRNSRLYQDNEQYNIFDNTTTRLNVPSLDIYYQLTLPHKQRLYFDLVGSYLDSRNNHSYRMSREEETVDAFNSHIDGTKWSLFGEGIYEREFNFGKLTGGIKQRQEWLKNIYSGVSNSDVRMNSSQTNIYAEFQSRLRRVDYSVGLGALRTFSDQDGRHLEKYIFNPRLNLSWGVVRGLFVRFSGEISGYAPSLADLSSVTQQIDAYQARRGNPNLKTTTYYSAQLMANWDFCKFMGIGSIAIYNYDHKPVMEQDVAEDNMIIRTMDNQLGFHRLNWHTWLFIKPYKDYITIRFTTLYQRFISQGNNYTHTHSNLGFYGELFATWKNWTFVAEFTTASNNLWGETLRKGERNHQFSIRYNKPKWSAAVCVYNPFEKEYRQTVENFSAIAPYTQTLYSKNLTKVALLKFSFNLDFGKSRENARQRMSSEDTNTGIMSGAR